MTVAVPAAHFAGAGADATRRAWRRHGFFLIACASIVLAVFRQDVAALTHIWWSNTTFGHCLFIAPVIAWLVWQRRDGLAALTPAVWAPGLALVAIGGAGWLVGDAAGVALARQLGLVMILQGLVVTLLGPQIARALLFPLSYAFFLVPFGEGLTALLQTITVKITVVLLGLVGVSASVDGTLITTPAGYFAVAEACSGSKFVIAMAAFATLVANVCFVSWRRRIAFVAMAEAVAVIANGMRAFGTIYAASLTSVETATGFDHIVFGWVFFGLVMAAVVAIGWRWFDRDPDAPFFEAQALGDLPRRRPDALVAAVVLMALVLVFPVAARMIDARADRLPDHIALPQIPGWQRVSLSKRAPWQPSYPNADHHLFGRYADAQGTTVDVAVAVYASQHEGKELVGFGIGALQENDRWVKVADLPAIDGGAAMRMTAPGPVERVVVTWNRVGGVVTGDPRRVKLQTLKVRLLGGRQRAVALLLSAERLPGQDPVAAIRRFLATIGPVDAFADRLAETPA